MPRRSVVRHGDRVPKLCGADIELGNFVLGLDRLGGTGREASRALLREIDAPYADRSGFGVPLVPSAGGYQVAAYNPQDWGRKYLSTNGGCFYIDLDHLECCLPEVLSAYDHVAAWHAMLRIARRALEAANEKLPAGQKIHVLVNNSDGRGNAYGSHLNFLLGRRVWDNIFERKLHHMLYLAAFQVSSILYTGQGKVGAENGTPAVAFQLSQRADFFEALTGVQTTYQRPKAGPHDLLGDVYRAQRNLAQAAAEYTRGHELSPTDAILLQQRGHVNTFLGNYAAARADYDSAIALGRANEKAAYAPFRAYVSVYAGDAGAAIDELNQLVANVDSMGVPDPATAKAGALTNVAVIAIHTRRFPAAEAALKQLAPILLKQADAVGTPAFRRTQLATITYFQGWLAARRGNYVKASQAADSVTQLVAPDSNPRKMEPVHQLRGLVSLYARDYPAAALHLDQGNLLDPYIKYQLALAEEGAGNAERAKQLFREVASYNFNTLGFALVRKEAQQKAGPNTSS